jgi:ABC-type multidrug transport system ATPase subunit
MDVGFKSVSAVHVNVRELSVHVKSEHDIRSYVPEILFRREGRAPKSRSKVILDDVSADMPAGSLTAILGSSGSGKTTLLNAIAGRIALKSMTMSGDITFNRGGQLKDVRSAYVMQEDILLPTLTVREILQYAADLRLPSMSAREERHAVVEDIILELGLKECANTKIGTSAKSQCSGGEKRRTSIGVQLLADPSVLFCDEPTTGEFSMMEIIISTNISTQVSTHIVLSKSWRPLRTLQGQDGLSSSQSTPHDLKYGIFSTESFCSLRVLPSTVDLPMEQFLISRVLDTPSPPL